MRERDSPHPEYYNNLHTHRPVGGIPTSATHRMTIETEEMKTIKYPPTKAVIVKWPFKNNSLRIEPGENALYRADKQYYLVFSQLRIM